MVGSIWSRTCPFVTRSPSRTAIRVMRPVMSAEMSTFFFGWILPLAVTAATKSRRPACSNRTSTPRSRRAPALITTSPTISTVAPAPTSSLLRLDGLLQVLLLRLGLRHLQRMREVGPQREADRQARLKRLRRKAERVGGVLVADRLLLLRREPIYPEAVEWR